MGQPTTRQQAETLLATIAERPDGVEVVEKFINLTIAVAKRDLAEKVLVAIRVVNLRLVFRSADGTAMKQSIVAELERLFAAEAIQLTTTPQQEGE